MMTHSTFFGVRSRVSDQSAGAVVKDTATVREVWGSIPRPFKSDIMPPTARHSCDVFSELSCPGAEPCLRRNAASTVKI